MVKDLSKLLDLSDYDWSTPPVTQYLPPYSPSMVEIELQMMAFQLKWLKEKEENGTR